ncbi:hypothetical protein QD460_00940 [Rhizobium jaguaris]|uniref:Uncharacterized protein n=1 Tax=Rhizobium jaguaris TaxID=1312183 RepID=A0A387FVC7_9HYPH|nr:hypothetical protein [Rhizobium jaguaris]AYG63100.1 hypothetical protein CCGE525_30855 [Rhizobium jaguaris]
MVRFIYRNMALLLATVMTALAITMHNMFLLLVRHHHTVLHDIRHAVFAIVLFGIFYAILRYIQALPDDAD